MGRPIGLLVGAFCLLILLEPDLGTVITIVVMVGAVLLISGTPLPALASAYTLVIGLGALAAWTSPYRRARLFTFLDPWKDPLGAGLQNVQAQISIGSGGIFGRGLGQGIEKIHYLPEAHTDMIFAVIGEELGLVGAAVLMLGYCAFAYAGLRLAIACKDPFGKRLAAPSERQACPRPRARRCVADRVCAHPPASTARRGARRRRLRRGADGARRLAEADRGCADGSGCEARAREPARRAVRTPCVP